MKSFKKIKTKKNLLIFSSLLFLLLAICVGYYFYYQYKKSQALLNNPTVSAQQQIIDLKNKVNKLIQLPLGEEPTVATVSDINKLKSQPFFAKAQNNDKVLIYIKARKAYLYRPSLNKLIEVASYNSPQTAQITASISPTTIPTTKIYKIVLYNGTLTAGLAALTQANIEKNSKDFIVSSKGDASNSNYTQTLVVDVSGSNKNAAEELAGLVNGKVGKLPAGEKLPTGVDFLVILGSSK